MSIACGAWRPKRGYVVVVGFGRGLQAMQTVRIGGAQDGQIVSTSSNSFRPASRRPPGNGSISKGRVIELGSMPWTSIGATGALAGHFRDYPSDLPRRPRDAGGKDCSSRNDLAVFAPPYRTFAG